MISVRGEAGEENLPLEEFEGRVREGRIAPNTQVCFPVLTGDRWVDARELELFRRLHAPARIHFSRTFSLGRFPWVTAALCLLQVVIYLGIAGPQRVIPLDPLIEAGAKMQPNILELGETWRLLTANLLHRDVLHLLFNMFFLFNVGGTIENAYRLQDYLLILVASALATTLTSTALSSLPSVGASGMVLGLFGSASVFGYKYGDILPARYRRYFGGAVLPYALFILYVGLATENTDNWGHLGGLLGGLAVTVPLEPRLLHLGRRRGALAESASLLVAAALVGVTLVCGPLMRASGPRLEVLEDGQSGLAFAYPAGWSFGENHLGHPAWGNTLGASIGVRAERVGQGPLTLAEVRRRFEAELELRQHDGDIAGVKVLGERPFEVPGGRALELMISLESRVGRQLTRNLLVERGYYGYAIVFSAPAVWAEPYAPIFERMARRVALIEPEGLGKARQLVGTFPGMSSAHVELGRHLASVGQVDGAARAYQRALEALPEHADALYGLAKLAYDYGGDLVSARRIAGELFARQPGESSYAALYADLEQRLGAIETACGVLQDALDRASDPPEELRRRLRALACRADGLGER